MILQSDNKDNYRDCIFACIQASMKAREVREQNLFEIAKLMKVLSSISEIFTESHRDWLDVFSIATVTLVQMETDDSFQLNKVFGKVKKLISQQDDYDEQGSLPVEEARRDALMEAVLYSEKLYKKKWAQTSVRLLVDYACSNLDKFHPDQRKEASRLKSRIEELKKAGSQPPSKDTITSFDRATSTWQSRRDVSSRGKVGASGDAQAENWLG